MSDLTKLYMVSIYESQHASGTLTFTYMPKQDSREPSPSGVPKRPPQYVVSVSQVDRPLTFNWRDTPDNPGAAKEIIEADVASRMTDRQHWIERVTALANQLEQWATEMGWSTRRIEKKLEDARVGEHRVPALLMQEDTCRILLEPIGRSAPGAEGVVDLYLMPAYDDIASLYYYQNHWNVHYIPSGSKTVSTSQEATAMPLDKAAFEKILAEMRQNAA